MGAAAPLELSLPVRPPAQVEQADPDFCADPPALALAPSPCESPGDKGTSLAYPLTGFLQGGEERDDRAGPPGHTGSTPAPPWKGPEGFPAFSLPDLFVPASEVLALMSAEEEVRVCMRELWSTVVDLMRENFTVGLSQVDGPVHSSPPNPLTGLRGAGDDLPAAVQCLAALSAAAASTAGNRVAAGWLPNSRCCRSSCTHWTGAARCVPNHRTRQCRVPGCELGEGGGARPRPPSPPRWWKGKSTPSPCRLWSGAPMVGHPGWWRGKITTSPCRLQCSALVTGHDNGAPPLPPQGRAGRW